VAIANVAATASTGMYNFCIELLICSSLFVSPIRPD
jgi:hypothetical protein